MRMLSRISQTYPVENAIKMITRKKKESRLKFGLGLSYFLLLGGLLTGQQVIVGIIKEEYHQLKNLTNEAELLANVKLIDFLSQIKFSFLLLSLALAVLGYYFLKTSLRQSLLILEEEIRTKQFLGSSLSLIAQEFYLEQVLPTILGGVLGIILVIMCYLLFFVVATWGYHFVGLNDLFLPIKVGLLIFIVGSLAVFRQFQMSKKKISRLSRKR